jgi:hypothetical protein
MRNIGEYGAQVPLAGTGRQELFDRIDKMGKMNGFPFFT